MASLLLCWCLQTAFFAKRPLIFIYNLFFLAVTLYGWLRVRVSVPEDAEPVVLILVTKVSW